MTISPALDDPTRADFETLITAIRPELRRYVARMIGSVIDAEDVVQEALVKAYSAFPTLTSNVNVRGWLFRIAHNQAIDHLRVERREVGELLDEYPQLADPDTPLEQKELATMALSVFLQLAPRQRSCVILKDVMDYSLVEISELLNQSVPEIKAALHRGRSRLRELAATVELRKPRLDQHEQALLARYVDRFNARDFDALREMLAADVHVELVGRTTLHGADVVSNTYFYNYSQVHDWRVTLGFVENRPAILVYNTQSDAPQPASFIFITWEDGLAVRIRDYRYAPQVVSEATVTDVS